MRMERTQERRSPTVAEREAFEAFGLEGETVDVGDVWIEHPLDNGWRAAFRLAHFGPSGFVVSEVRVFPADDWKGRRSGRWRAHLYGEHARELDGVKRGAARMARVGHGLTAQLLRKVPFNVVQQYSQELSRYRRTRRAEAQDAAPRPKRRPAVGWPDARYARLAAAYVDRLQSGGGKPVAYVASRFKLRPSQARDAIRAARERGILTETTARARTSSTACSRMHFLTRQLASTCSGSSATH